MANTRQWGLPGFPPVIKNLIIINILVWLLEVVTMMNGNDWIIHHFALYDIRSSNFKPWQFFTYMFLHEAVDDRLKIVFTHIFFNMFALWMFGSALENLWGSRRFLIFYLICGVGSVVIFSIITYMHNTQLLAFQPADLVLDTPILGASGAIFGVLVAFGYTFPNVEMIILPIPIPIKAKWLVIGYILIELYAGVHQAAGDEVAHYAHLGGALVGFLLVFFWNRKYRRRRQDFY